MTRDKFEPRLGKSRERSPDPYARLIDRLVAKSGGTRARRSNRFTGSRISRGTAAGRRLASGDRYGGLRSRRVVVKARIVRLAAKGRGAVKAHLRYLQRDGVTREGAPGDLYDREHDKVDGKALLERSEGDRHQFRFIVSPEDAIEHPDLKSLTRRLMAQMEQDLGTRLDWVAVDHYNTGHPHTHVLVRGKDNQGRDLVIAPEYMTHGIRGRAAELVTLDLGPRTDHEVETGLRAEMEQERFTSLDRGLIREAEDGLVRSGTEADAFRQTLRAGRLQKLRRLGLAEEVAPSQWRIAPDLEPVLREMGERDDIIKTMHREMVRAGVTKGADELVINSAISGAETSISGRVLGRGLSDELNDRHYLIVDGIDGRVHYTDIGRGDATEVLPEGSIVAITANKAAIRQADRTIAEVAEANDGRYSIDLHLRHDPAATEEYVRTHVRRLEAMRRARTDIERQPDGTWIVAPDHLEKALRYEQQKQRAVPVSVQMLSALPLEQIVPADGATWLDRELVAKEPATIRDAGFGREVRDALVRRQQWLIEQGLAEQQEAGIVYRANLLNVLRRREVQRVGTQLSKELELGHAEVKDGTPIEGVYRRRLNLISGQFAVIENSREFSLVPWRPVLQHNLGKSVTGISHGDTISWSIGLQRGLGIG